MIAIWAIFSFLQGTKKQYPKVLFYVKIIKSMKIVKNKKIESLNFSVNDLILFCIHSIISNSEQCSFERLVKECFTLFPETLKFPRYPIWPDSRKLDRPLRALRNERLIIGDPKTYFILTKTGEEKVVFVSKSLRQGKLL